MQSEMTNCLIYVRDLLDSIRVGKDRYTIDGSKCFLGSVAFMNAVVIAHHYEQIVMRAALSEDEELREMARKALNIMKDERNRGFEKAIHERLRLQAKKWLEEAAK